MKSIHSLFGSRPNYEMVLYCFVSMMILYVNGFHNPMHNPKIPYSYTTSSIIMNNPPKANANSIHCNCCNSNGGFIEKQRRTLFHKSSLHSYGHHSRLTLSQLRAGSSDVPVSFYNNCTQQDEFMAISRQRERQRAIYAILTSTTLNLLGFTLTSPLNPALGSHFDLPLGASFGSLTSAYPAGMLLGQLVWARMSDFIGRKRILSISLLGGGIGLTLQSMSICYRTSLHVFLATRVFTGIFSGVAPVAKAYLADLGEEVERSKGKSSSSSEQGLVAKYLGWRDAASTLAYILGPALGGILFERVKDSAISTTTTASNETGALAFVIGIAGLASIIASGCITMFVREEFKPKQSLKRRRQSKHLEYKSKEESKIESIAEKSYESMSCPLGSQLWSGVASVCIISFLYHVSDSTFFAFYPALLQNRFGLDARAVGMSFTAFACISFLFSAMSLSSRMIEKVGVVYTCVAGLTSLGTGLTALSFLGKIFASSISLSSLKVFTWMSAAVYFSGVPLYGPTVPLMLLMCVPSHQRGAIMGLDGAVNTIARIISPIIMGDVYRRGGSQLTFRLAGAAAFASAGIASSRRFYVHRRAKKEKSRHD